MTEWRVLIADDEPAARRDGDVLDISVTGDGAEIPAGAKQEPGHGLANTRERLRTLYGERATLVVEALSTGGTSARLRIPYRKIVLEPSRD